jgi:predicted Zn-dependent protease with MMP-like domain
MSTIWEIPLTPRPQTMRIDIGSAFYVVSVKFNTVIKAWVMDIDDAVNNPVLHGIPLVTGTDLFGQFRYMGIGGGLPMIVMTIGPGRSPDDVPNYQNLGIDGHVYFKTLV